MKMFCLRGLFFVYGSYEFHKIVTNISLGNLLDKFHMYVDTKSIHSYFSITFTLETKTKKKKKLFNT